MQGEPMFDPKADSPLSDDALRAKKDRYARFDAERALGEITRAAFGSAVVSAEPLGTGANAFDHIVYRVHTDDGRTFVARINADESVAEHFPIEAALYRAWRDAGVPMPDVFAVALRTEPGGIDYQLLEYIDARDIEKVVQEDPARAPALAHAAGAFLARLHTLALPGFGALTLKEGALTGAHNSWKDAIRTRLDETLAYLQEQGLLSGEETERVQRAFVTHADVLNLTHGVALHGDYHHANILVDPAGTVRAAVDLTQAKVGDPVFDLAFYSTYVSPELFDAFKEGYFSSAPRVEDLERKLALYRLRIFASKAKLRKRFGYDERIPAAIEGMRAALA